MVSGSGTSRRHGLTLRDLQNWAQKVKVASRERAVLTVLARLATDRARRRSARKLSRMAGAAGAKEWAADMSVRSETGKRNP